MCTSDYKALADAELSIREGDVLDVVKVGSSGWWLVKVYGKFPQELMSGNVLFVSNQSYIWSKSEPNVTH